MKNNMVRKANVLVEASYKLTTQEQRVILFLVSLIKPDDEDFKDYTISVKDFSDLVGGNKRDQYREIKEITKKLIGRVFTIQSQGRELQISWLSSAEYVTGKGMVVLSFDKKLKPFLLQLKSRFTKYRLHQVMQLKSSFSIRIYEFLKQYQKLGERVFEIDDLRNKLGIEKEQYKNFNDFKRFVLLAAQEELAEKTDIAFTFEEIKVGRGVGKVRFFIESKSQETECRLDDIPPELQPLPISPEPLVDDELRALIALLPADYREKESILLLLKTWLGKQNFAYVSRNIEYANAGSNAVKAGKNLGKGSNYRVYLSKALVGDFGLPFKEDLEAKREAEAETKRKSQEAAAAQRQRHDQVKREKEDMERARVFQQSLPPEALETLKGEAFSRLPTEQQELVKRKAIGADMILRLMMDKISLERMKIS